MQPRESRILIIDDEPDRSKPWADTLRKLLGDSINIEAPPVDKTRELVASIFSRRKKIRDSSGSIPISGSGIPCEFDDVDILVLDYDLQNLERDQESEWTTGAEVATAARAYSSVGMLVLINSMGVNRFDLTMKKSAASRADLDIGDAQLLNPGLWMSPHSVGFRPWLWPDVLAWPARYAKAVEWITERLDLPVFKELGFHVGGKAPGGELSSEQWVEYLGLNPDTTTFRQLVQTHQFLPLRDREVVAKDSPQCARVAAAILKGWLDRIVVPCQETLIDAPHLAYQMPWLLRDPKDRACWDQTTDPAGPKHAFKVDLAEFTYDHPLLLSRPAYFRRLIERDDVAAEPVGFNYNECPDLVFCEDISGFAEFSDARPFPSSLPCTDNQRYVINPDRVKSPAGPQCLNDVDYEPASLFAL
jgi:hypothetical protein